MSYADLPALNATLNGLAALVLLVGFVLIRSGRRRAHRAAMVTAVFFSALFLVSYLVYHFQVGSVRFSGAGPVRSLYLSILASHTILAMALPVLVVVTLWRAHRGRFDRHRSIARWTLPIWLWVSVTGVVIYWMLYRM